MLNLPLTENTSLKLFAAISLNGEFFMYYLLILLSVVMFGGGFALNDVYRKLRGSSLYISLQFTLISSVVGLFILLAINGFRFEFTWFTLIMSLIMTADNIAFTFCGFRALSTINLSLYSLFSMLGGMLLPFLQGILFYGEGFTFGKAVCLLFICAALLLTIERKKDNEKKRGGTIYYIGIFILNGMSGVISKLFTSSPFEKTSAAGFSILCAISSAVVSLILLVIMASKNKEVTPMTFKSNLVGAAAGGINRIANYFLVIALAYVDASVQYPLVTGGVMVVSTLLCFFGKNKPSKREIISIILAFLGMLALFLIRI